jgi:RNA polymerase sigma-70 factor (ECF subfamily)
LFSVVVYITDGDARMADHGLGQHGTHADVNGREAMLVMRSVGGDRLAFEQLVQCTARWLFARIYLSVSDPHRCEDLVQETYLRAWRSIGSLSDPNTFRGWLAAIAHGVVVDSIKHDSRLKRGAGANESSQQSQQQMLQVADGAPSPVQSLEMSERRAEVVELLKSLPREYQDVLSLRYISGADYQTIAKQLAISNGSLRGLLNRGMKMLRDRLKDGTTDEHG